MTYLFQYNGCGTCDVTVCVTRLIKVFVCCATWQPKDWNTWAGADTCQKLLLHCNWNSPVDNGYQSASGLHSGSFHLILVMWSVSLTSEFQPRLLRCLLHTPGLYCMSVCVVVAVCGIAVHRGSVKISSALFFSISNMFLKMICAECWLLSAEHPLNMEPSACIHFMSHLSAWPFDLASSLWHPLSISPFSSTPLGRQWEILTPFTDHHGL